MPTPQFDIDNVLKRAMNIDISTEFQPYSGVEIVVDDTTSYTAGDATGRVLTIENPWGTQAQADNILNAIRGYTYQPYNAQGALLDPATEIGDGVSINDVYGGVYKISKRFSSLMASDVSAPQSEEIDHEYPYESSNARSIQRKFSAMESELRMTSAEISAKVSQVGGGGSFSWSLLSDRFQIFSAVGEVFRVDATGAYVYGHITATSGKIGGFSIGANEITYNNLYWGDTTKAGIYIGTSGIQLGRRPQNSSDNTSYFAASAYGDVEARNLKLTGTLNINGTNITAEALRSGAQSAYNNSSTWTTGSGYGYNYNNATQNNTSSYPSYFTVTNLTVKNRASVAYLNASSFFGCPATFQVGGIDASWKQVTINGTTIKYLGRS